MTVRMMFSDLFPNPDNTYSPAADLTSIWAIFTSRSATATSRGWRAPRPPRPTPLRRRRRASARSVGCSRPGSPPCTGGCAITNRAIATLPDDSNTRVSSDARAAGDPGGTRRSRRRPVARVWPCRCPENASSCAERPRCETAGEGHAPRAGEAAGVRCRLVGVVQRMWWARSMSPRRAVLAVASRCRRRRCSVRTVGRARFPFAGRRRCCRGTPSCASWAEAAPRWSTWHARKRSTARLRSRCCVATSRIRRCGASSGARRTRSLACPLILTLSRCTRPDGPPSGSRTWSASTWTADRSQISSPMGPSTPNDVAMVGVAVADALTAAHHLGILHRDVKPGNVLLAHDGRIKLGDFGIARLLVGQSVATTDQIAFTPEHVAPEILRNEPEGPWSDVYGLASTLATALVGSPPFQQRTGERMEAFLSRKVLAPPPVLSNAVPAALAGPVTRALDPEPSRRPSVTELRDQLAEAARSLGESVPLAPPMPHLATRPSPTPPPVTNSTGSATQPWRNRHTPIRSAAASPGGRAGRGAVDARRFRCSSRSCSRRSRSRPSASCSSPLTMVTAPTGPPPARQVRSPLPPPRPWRRQRFHHASGQPTPTAPPTPPTTTTTPAAVALPPPTTTTAALPAPPTAPTTSAPTTATTTPAPTPAPAAAVTPAQAESFVRGYFDAVAAGDYTRSWSQLTPEFQHGKARSYEYYVGFWDDNDIAVDDVELVDADPSRAIVDVVLRWNGSSDATTDRFELRRGPDGQLLIARQDTIAR